MHMSKAAYRVTVPLLVSVALLMPGTAGAGVSVGIGFGGIIGSHHHHGHGGWSIGLGFYDPWYDPWYHPWHYGPWYDPWYAPVVVERPVVVEKRVVVKEHKPPAPAPAVKSTDQLSERQQQERSELLRKLRIGDVNSRVQAVQDLGRFVHDDKTRTALQDALLSDRDAQVRKSVAELFGRLKDARTLPTLKRAYAADADRDVRQAAYKAMILMEGYEVNTN
jgi:hypothetical protein